MQILMIAITSRILVVNICGMGVITMEISDGLDIASYSMIKAQTGILQSVGTQMLKNTLDLQEMMGAEITQMMEQSVNPGLGQNIDIQI